MRRKRARLIYNPTSGKEVLRSKLPDLLNILEEGGFEASCHATKGAEDAVIAARNACADRFDLVIAAGGDGTINEVINGMSACDHRPPLGIIPAGTTNDLGRALRLPRDPIQACKVIVQQHFLPLDVGKVTRVEGDDLASDVQYFVNIAACGKLTEISYKVPSKLKTLLGQLAYYMKGLEKLPQVRPIYLDIESEEFRYSGKVMLCMIANSTSVAGFERLAPNARLDDGLFDVLIAKKMSIPELIRNAALAFRGEHINSDKVEYFQTKHLTIRCQGEVDLNLDGEYGGQLPRQFEMLKHHLQVAVRADTEPWTEEEMEEEPRKEPGEEMP
jgi:diacylglycerol kinase (ATP)